MKRYVGKKMKADAKNRRELKKIFEALGIVRCEEEGCGTDFGLSFAHSKKRKDIHSEADMKEVALLCIPHHEKYERLPPPEMTIGIRAIIAKRETAPIYTA